LACEQPYDARNDGYNDDNGHKHARHFIGDF
jgi:hypothetical protein